jgi:hypothetical protein
VSEQRIGDWRVICDASGIKCWASETVLQWNGLRVLRRFADLSRHPQDFVRGIPDKPQVPWTRPEPSDHSVSPFIEDETGFSLFDEVAVALSQN